jgi:hypothetical protein
MRRFFTGDHERYLPEAEHPCERSCVCLCPWRLTPIPPIGSQYRWSAGCNAGSCSTFLLCWRSIGDASYFGTRCWRQSGDRMRSTSLRNCVFLYARYGRGSNGTPLLPRTSSRNHVSVTVSWMNKVPERPTCSARASISDSTFLGPLARDPRHGGCPCRPTATFDSMHNEIGRPDARTGVYVWQRSNH